MPFDFVASADWHIGASRKLPGYLERQNQMMDKIAEVVTTRTSSGVLLVSADLLDRENVLPKERDSLLTKLLQYDTAGITTIIIDGNHDRLSKNHSNLSFIEIMTNYGVFKHLKIATIKPKKFTIFKQDILAVPWMGCTEGEYNKRVKTWIRDTGCIRPIVMTHEQFRGCADDLGFETNEGPLPDKKLMEGVHILVAGHVHKMQRILPRAFYSGSPMQKTFGETPDKGVLYFQSDKPDEPEFIQLEGLKQLVTLTSIPKKWPDAYIKLKLPKGTKTGVLPDSVVYNTYLSAEDNGEDIRKVDLSNPLDGMYELLIHYGLSKRQAQQGMELAKELYNGTRGIN